MITNSIHPKIAKYFQFEGITEEILKKYAVQINGSSEQDFQIHYPYSGGGSKICFPFKDRKDKWKWIKHPTNKSECPIFGFLQLPPTGDVVLIAAGEKDTMTLSSLGYASLCLNSETKSIPNGLIKHLQTNFKNVIICFDNDEPGRKAAEKTGAIFRLPHLILPDGIYGKDITDYLASGKTKEDVEILIQESLKLHRKTQTYFQASELLGQVQYNRPYLVEGIIPSNTLIGLIGGSDSGKSLICLQFSISSILGTEYLGQRINGCKKVLYFSFEDDQYSIKDRLFKLTSVLTSEQKNLIEKNLFFEFSSDDFLGKIENHLQDNPDTHLIIIDPYSELMLGQDINNLGTVRESLKPLHLLTIKYDLTIMIVHHINKNSEESGKTSKHSAHGSSGFEAKIRTLIDVTTLKGGQTQLSIVKGNDIPKNLKFPEKSLKIGLRENSLWFTHEVPQIPINKASNPISIVNWTKVFDGKEQLKRIDLNNALQLELNKTRKAVDNWIDRYLTEFKAVEGGYYINPNSKTESPVILKNQFPQLLKSL